MDFQVILNESYGVVEATSFDQVKEVLGNELKTALELIEKVVSRVVYDRLVEDIDDLVSNIERYQNHLKYQLNELLRSSKNKDMPSSSYFSITTLGYSNKQGRHDGPHFSDAEFRSYGSTRRQIVKQLELAHRGPVNDEDKYTLNSLIDNVNDILRTIYTLYLKAKKREMPRITNSRLKTTLSNMIYEHGLGLLKDNLKF